MTERIEELTKVMTEYGERSIQNMKLCRKLGRSIIMAFDQYLSSKGGFVIGVPPQGEWEPERGDYNDAAFSFGEGGLIMLEDIQLGISVRIPHSKDDGNLWMRIVVNLRKEGERFGISVPEDASPIWIPLEYRPSDLQVVCDALFAEALRTFEENLLVFADGRGRSGTIGFINARSSS